MTAKPYKLKKEAPAPDPGSQTPDPFLPFSLTLDRKALLTPIEKACHVIPSGKASLLPILSNVLLDLGPHSTLYATDLTTSAIMSLSITTPEPRRLLVPAKLMKEILGSFDDKDITVSVDAQTLTIGGGRSTYRIPLGDPDEFPEVKPLTEPSSLSISAGDFMGAVNKVYYALASDETRYVLLGLHLATDIHTMTVETSDGFRAAQYTKTMLTDLPALSAIVPRRLLQVLSALAAETDNLDITITKERIQVMTARMTIMGRLIEGQYPDISNTIHNPASIATVDGNEFAKLLKRASIMSITGEPVTFGLEHDSLVMSVESQAGYAEERMVCNYDGPDQKITLKITNLLDVVPKLSNGDIDIGFSEGYGAVQMNEQDYINLLMPLRV